MTVASHTPFTNRRILLAEDNEVNRMVAIITLENLGASVTAVINGREAVDTAIAQRFDIILMDCQMPEMDGYEATRILKARMSEGLLAKTPIIAMTANAMKGDRELCLTAGMDDYISKPVRKGDIINIIQRWMSNASQAG